MTIIHLPKPNIRIPLDRLPLPDPYTGSDHYDALDAHERFPFADGPDRRHSDESESTNAGVSELAHSSPITSVAVGIGSDPAPVVALVFMLACTFSTVGRCLPRPAAVLLIEHVRRGDCTSRQIANWLLQRRALSERDEAKLLTIIRHQEVNPTQQIDGGRDA